jgi:hypothetical protein
MEGPIMPNECMLRGGSCERQSKFDVFKHMNEAAKQMPNFFDSISNAFLRCPQICTVLPFLDLKRLG